jgi:hypothetical protein
MAERKTAKRTRLERPAPTLSTAWAAALLALLVVVFFHEVVVGGKTLVSPDATAPAGFVRMGEHSLSHDHVYPQWNPYVFLGMPSFASGTYNPYIYPPDWPVAILQRVLPLPELTWMLIYYLLAGVATFVLAREWGARPEGAMLGAVAFVFAPNLIAVGSHGHGSQLVDSAYIPLMLWLATRWMRTGRTAFLAALALAGGFQMLRGHVQICFYTWLAIGLYTVFDLAASTRQPGAIGPRGLRAAGVLGAALLAFGIAGAYNLPLRDYARYSIRGSAAGGGGGVGMDYATQWSLAPYELPSMVVPGWTGFGGSTYWGGMPFTDYPNAFVGIVAVVLLLPAFLTGGATRAFALALAIVSLFVAFGKNGPVYGLLYDHLPLFNKFRIPVMIVVLLQVAVALGAAWGWTAVIESDAKQGRRLSRLLVITAGVLVVALLVGLAGDSLLRGPYLSMAIAHGSAPGRPFPPELAAQAFAMFRGDLVRAAFLGLIAIGLAWFASRRRLGAAVASVGVVLLALVELWPVSNRVMEPALGDPIQRNLELGRDDIVDFLQKVAPPGTSRVLPSQDFQSNRLAGFGIASVGGYHAAKPRIFQDFMDAHLIDHPAWLRLLNVRYLILPQQLPSPPPYLALVHSGTSYTGQPTFVYENQLALPRATVVGAYRIVTPAIAILDSVAAHTVDAADVTYLEEDPKLTLGPVTNAHAEIASYRLNDVTVDVDTPGPGLLRLADLWYPDWTVTVDGSPSRLLKADYLLRAVSVPAGKHRVVFRFESPAMRRGLLLSVGSLVVVLALFGVDFFIRRRRAAPPPVAVAASASGAATEGR